MAWRLGRHGCAMWRVQGGGRGIAVWGWWEGRVGNRREVAPQQLDRIVQLAQCDAAQAPGGALPGAQGEAAPLR